MKKRILSLILALLVVVGLSACGKDNTVKTPEALVKRIAAFINSGKDFSEIAEIFDKKGFAAYGLVNDFGFYDSFAEALLAVEDLDKGASYLRSSFPKLAEEFEARIGKLTDYELHKWLDQYLYNRKDEAMTTYFNDEIRPYAPVSESYSADRLVKVDSGYYEYSFPADNANPGSNVNIFLYEKGGQYYAFLVNLT